ncbi:MAG: hypothetical protein AB2693_31010 [Candidatus Thiodiazotropha sp.]
MVFLIWIAVWLYWADFISLLLIPFLALVVRSNYMDRTLISVLPIFPLIASLILFVSYYYSGDDIAVAATKAIKILLSALIMFHLLEGTKNVNFRFYGKTMQRFAFIMQRAWAVEKTRFADVFYAIKVRWSHPNTPLHIKLFQIYRAIVQLFNELLDLVRRFEITLASRGGWPPVELWVVPGQRAQPPIVGDMIIFVLAILPAVILPRGWVPETMVKLVNIATG